MMLALKGKSLRKATETGGLERLEYNLPLIYDKTMIIDRLQALDMLKKNKGNRVLTNDKKVKEYARVMKSGRWQLSPQGIVLDHEGNILTGQKRLLAVVAADVSVPFRVSFGCPKELGDLLDRGMPQTSRDLASRRTGRAHSPAENSIARVICASLGFVSPNTEQLCFAMETNSDYMSQIISLSRGTKKTKAVIMIMAMIIYHKPDEIKKYVTRLEIYANKLTQSVLPANIEKCWRGSALLMATEKAKEIVLGD